MLNPSPAQVVPRAFWPALALAVLSGLAGQCLLAIRPGAFTLHYFRNPWMLAAVHLSSLGWLGTLFLAVLLQAQAVLSHQAQPRARRGWAGPYLFHAGALGLVVYLAGWREAPLLLASLAGLVGGYAVSAARVYRLAPPQAVPGNAWPGLVAALAYLGLLLLLGALMACGLLRPCLPQDPLATLGLHIHLALAGFAGLAILGLLPKLLRLFLGASRYPVWPSRWAGRAVHAGLALHVAGWILGSVGLVQAATVLLFGAALGLCAQVLLLAGKATKPRFNSSFVLQGSAQGWLLVAAGLDLWLAFRPPQPRLAAAAVDLALFGWIGGTLLGTIQRVSAVLAWFQRFYENPPQHRVPTAWELVDPRLAWAAAGLHPLAVAAGGLGLAWGDAALIRGAGVAGAASLLCTVAVAGLSLRRGQKEDFTDGMNPYLAPSEADASRTR